MPPSSTPQQKPPSSESFISPSCCFTCDDFDLGELLSWTGLTDITEETADTNSDIEWQPEHNSDNDTVTGTPLYKSKSSITQSRNNKYAPVEPKRSNSFSIKKRFHKVRLYNHQQPQHPPPVIALSRSSFSYGSVSSAESALENTEVDRQQDERRTQRRKKIASHKACSKHNPCNSKTESTPCRNASGNSTVGNSSSCGEIDFAARHEQLINALFEDAKHRSESRIPSTPPPHASELAMTPPRTPSSRKVYKSEIETPSAVMSTSASSRYSRRSSTSHNSDLLSPSSHQFQRNIKTKRKSVVCTLSAMRQYQNKQMHKRRDSRRYRNGSIASSFCSTPCRTNEDSSFTSFSTLQSRGDTAHSFLHSQCILQKDSGKGVDPGSSITAKGKEIAMAKLIEKMDLLAEVEQEGSFSNAVLTRVPAKNMTAARREVNFDNSDPCTKEGFIETRSMLAVKMGFMSLKYGIIVHWNEATGLAELIVLRKMCSDSFMKVKQSQKGKSWRKRMRKMSATAAMKDAPTVTSPQSIDIGGSSDSVFDELQIETAETL